MSPSTSPRVGRPARVCLALGAIAAAATAAAVTAAAFVERARPGLTRAGDTFPALPIERVDVHVHAQAATLDYAAQLDAARGHAGRLVNLSGGWPGDGLEGQLDAASRHRGRVLVFMNLDPAGCCDAAWAAREADRLALGRKAGAAGLDVDVRLAPTPLDGGALDPIWEACQAARLPISVHASTPALLSELERLAARRPALAFLALDAAAAPDEMARLLDRLANLHWVPALRGPGLARGSGATREVILAHPKQVLFGTDTRVVAGAPGEVLVLGAGETEAQVRATFAAWHRFYETRDPLIPVPGGEPLAGLGLPRAALERIYHRNAEALLGLAPEEP